jgi:hypothetical protein
MMPIYQVFTEAWPRLKAKGFPFTVFVATDPIDLKHRRLYELGSSSAIAG